MSRAPEYDVVVSSITGKRAKLFRTHPEGNRRLRRAKAKMDNRFEVALRRYVYEGRKTEAFWMAYNDEAECFDDLTADERDEVLSRGW